MKLYINHGRLREDQGGTDVDGNEGDGWGFDGPTLGGVKGFHCTYGPSGHFNVYFTSKEARDAAFERTGWETWNDNALTARFSGDCTLLKCWNKIRQRWEYFGDWGLE